MRINLRGDGWISPEFPTCHDGTPNLNGKPGSLHNQKVRWTVTSVEPAHAMKSMLDEERETLSASALYERIKQIENVIEGQESAAISMCKSLEERIAALEARNEHLQKSYWI